MPKKRYTPEEIVAKLRQVDVLVSQGQNIADAIRQIGPNWGMRLAIPFIFWTNGSFSQSGDRACR
jgi:hypothetical protein